MTVTVWMYSYVCCRGGGGWVEVGGFGWELMGVANSGNDLDFTDYGKNILLDSLAKILPQSWWRGREYFSGKNSTKDFSVWFYIIGKKYIYYEEKYFLYFNGIPNFIIFKQFNWQFWEPQRTLHSPTKSHPMNSRNSDKTYEKALVLMGKGKYLKMEIKFAKLILRKIYIFNHSNFYS